MMRKPSHADGGAVARERKGLWSPEEDEQLYTQITHHGVSTWSSTAKLAGKNLIGLRRSGKSCRLRWMNYLRPDLKKEPISKREEETIISLQKVLGNRWSVIAARMPGRTDNEIKNYWNSRIRKRRQNVNAGGGCTEGDLPSVTSKPACREKESSSTVSAVPPIPARFPVFACQPQLFGRGGGDAIASAGTQSTTTHEQNACSESEVSVVNGGEDAREHCYRAGDGDRDTTHLFSFDDLEYPTDLLMDVPGLLDAWEIELYGAKFEEHC